MKRLVFIAVLATFAVLGVSTVGCQIYDFQVVSQGTLSQTEESFPLTPPLKPNLWLLVDRSGSMSTVDPCTGGSCPSRLSSLQSAMSTFLANSGTVARMGLTFFPAPREEGSCVPAHENAVELPAPTSNDDPSYDDVLRAQANLINSKIRDVPLAGGTPTGLSVRFVGSQPGLLNPDDGRDDFILLLTDGLPNCNSENVFGTCGCVSGSTNTCTDAQKASCRCTQSFSNGTPNCFTAATCQACLDQAASAAEIAAVKSKGIRTIVLAFAPGFTAGDGPETLAAMATAGGGNFRTCTTDATCGAGDHCVLQASGGTGLCHRQYYMANNASELGDMLAQIQARSGSILARSRSRRGCRTARRPSR